MSDSGDSDESSSSEVEYSSDESSEGEQQNMCTPYIAIYSVITNFTFYRRDTIPF